MKDDKLQPAELDVLGNIRARTPARVLAGRAGAGYLTPMQLELRHAHAAARDAVRMELDLNAHLGAEFVGSWGMVDVETQAKSKDEYLLRPDLGRQLSDDSVRTVIARCRKHADLQIVI